MNELYSEEMTSFEQLKGKIARVFHKVSDQKTEIFRFIVCSLMR